MYCLHQSLHFVLSILVVVVCLLFSYLQPSYAPDFTVYSGPMSQGPNSGKNSSTSTMTSAQASFFLSENLRQELQQQQLACLSMPVPDTSCPREVDKYHSLCPLEPVDAPPDQVKGSNGAR